MKTRFCLIAVLAILIPLTGWRSRAAEPEATPAPASRYVLLSGSYLLEDCPVCARVSIEEPMRGTFDLRLQETNAFTSRYSLENITFTAGTSRTYTVKGSGTFEIGGDFAYLQH